MERRYFFYLIAINLVVNIGMFVPAILLRHRFGGAVMSILVAVVVGTLLAACYLSLSEKLPLLTYPELLDRFAPKWMAWSCKTLMILIWYWVGLITLLTFVKLTHRLFVPTTSEYVVISVFLLLVVWASQLSSRTILLALEALLALNAPLMAGFLFKLVTEPNIEPDGVLDVITYLWHMPELESVASATFVFSGYANMTAFQKVFRRPVGMKTLWLLPAAGLFSLVIGFFSPILFHGTYGVMNYTFPFTATADSIRMELFVVERMLFIFLFIYVSISLFSIIVHWHVAFTALRNMAGSFRFLKPRAASWLTAVIFPAVSIYVLSRSTDRSIVQMSTLFMICRFLLEMVLVGTLWYMSRRAKS